MYKSCSHLSFVSSSHRNLPSNPKHPSQKFAASRNSQRTTIVKLASPFFASMFETSHTFFFTQSLETTNSKPFLSSMKLLIERQGMLCRCNLKSKLMTHRSNPRSSNYLKSVELNIHFLVYNTHLRSEI